MQRAETPLKGGVAGPYGFIVAAGFGTTNAFHLTSPRFHASKLGTQNSKPCPLHQRRIRFRMLEEGQEAVVTSQQMAYKLKDS